LESVVLKKDELTKMLLERNADVRRADHDGKTVLHHLCSSHVDAAHLIELAVKTPHGGAIVNARDLQGKTALLYAAACDNDLIVEYLVSLKECNINIALLETAATGTPKMLNTLLLAGANFTVTNMENADIFMIAKKRNTYSDFKTLPVFNALVHRNTLNVFSDRSLLEDPRHLEELMAEYSKRFELHNTIMNTLEELELRQGSSLTYPTMPLDLSTAAINQLDDKLACSRARLQALENVVLESARRIHALWVSNSDWEKKRNDVMDSPGFEQDPLDNVSLAISNGSTGAIALLAVPMTLSLEFLRKKCSRRVAYWENAMTVRYECSICMETCVDAQTVQDIYKKANIACPHFSAVCKDCFSHYFEMFLLDSKGIQADGIPCLNRECTKVVTEEMLRRMFSPKLVSKYKSLMLNAAIKEDPSSKWCSNYAKCKGIARKNSKGVGVCNKCNTLTCCITKSCGHSHHPRQTCERVRDKSIDNLKRLHGWQNCPECKALVEKIDGCDHMDCIVCKCQFCYFCGKTPRCGQRCSKRIDE
jgi:hypothetical protein